MRSVSVIFFLLLIAVPAAGQVNIKTTAADSTNPLGSPSEAPNTYRCTRGGFETRMPSGCSRVQENWSEPHEEADPRTAIELVNIFCDQHQRKGAGVSVSVIFNERNAAGELAGPPEVVARIEEQLSRYNARVVEQRPIRKVRADGRILEGMDVLAEDTEGPGRIWVRGLLEEADLYILTAWNREGGLWTDPEFQAFFNEFDLLD